MIKPRKVVEELDPYVPGRSIDEIASEYGVELDKIIKLGSNENPMGPSPQAVKAIAENLNLINQYPESDLQDLLEDIAEYSGVSPSNIIAGGDGADEILDVLGKTFVDEGDEFIVPLPSYMYYEFTLKIHGGVPVYARWNIEENVLDVDSVLEAISPRTKLIFLCTPNNPTGGLISKGDVERILEATEAIVVVDEAYFEFSEVNNVELLEGHPNLFILRTFSKVMGLAGMRIGYGIANHELIEYMYRVRPVFSITKLSQVAARATLKDKEYIRESTKLSIASREYLYHEMSKFKTLRVFPSKSNYLLVDLHKTGMKAKDLTTALMKRGVIVRDCTSFKGLDEYWIRVSVGTMEEDERFIEILRGIVE
ncbi:Histidinol-phosphate aminotransferase [anaerobic digester metagenome]